MRAVGAIIRHRNFDMNSYNHDVALIRLRKPVKFTKSVRPICLPKEGKKRVTQSKKEIEQKKIGDSPIVFFCRNVTIFIAQCLFIGTDPAGKTGTVVGWGRLKEGGALPGKVHEVEVPIYSLTQCRKMKYRANRISDNMICAGRGSQDSCQGDSGGPLLVQDGDKLELAGMK